MASATVKLKLTLISRKLFLLLWFSVIVLGVWPNLKTLAWPSQPANPKTKVTGIQEKHMAGALNLAAALPGLTVNYDPNAGLVGQQGQPVYTNPDAGSAGGTGGGGYNGGSNVTGGSGSGYTAPVVNPNQPYIDLINSSIGRLPGELATANSNLQQQYGTNLNQINSGEQAAQGQYGQSTTQNQQQFVSNKDQINNQASSGLRSLLRVLGQHGAGGSSAALYSAPTAVGNLASQQRAGAGQTFGQNQQGLDTNWNNYESGVKNSKQQLSDWLTSQQNQAASQSESSRQSLLQQLIGLQTSTAAAQPYVDQINASAAKADSLASFSPQYTGVTPTYTAPDVASYTVNQAGAPQVQGGPSGSNTPALSFLLNQQKKQPLQF